MSIYVHRNGEQLGPFDEPTLRNCLEAGEFSSTDLMWREGQAQWEPISSVLTPNPAVVIDPPAPAEVEDANGKREAEAPSPERTTPQPEPSITVVPSVNVGVSEPAETDTKFSWWPETRAGRIVQSALLFLHFFVGLTAGFYPRLYRTALAYLFYTALRYAFMRWIIGVPRLQRQVWWRNAGTVCVAAMLSLFVFCRPNIPRVVPGSGTETAQPLNTSAKPQLSNTASTSKSSKGEAATKEDSVPPVASSTSEVVNSGSDNHATQSHDDSDDFERSLARDGYSSLVHLAKPPSMLIGPLVADTVKVRGEASNVNARFGSVKTDSVELFDEVLPITQVISGIKGRLPQIIIFTPSLTLFFVDIRYSTEFKGFGDRFYLKTERVSDGAIVEAFIR